MLTVFKWIQGEWGSFFRDRSLENILFSPVQCLKLNDGRKILFLQGWSTEGTFGIVIGYLASKLFFLSKNNEYKVLVYPVAPEERERIIEILKKEVAGNVHFWN